MYFVKAALGPTIVGLFSEIWYSLWSRDTRCTTKVKVMSYLIVKFFKEIGVTESNANVRLVAGKVCAHAQYKFNQKHPRTTGVTSGSLQVAMH